MHEHLFTPIIPNRLKQSSLPVPVPLESYGIKGFTVQFSRPVVTVEGPGAVLKFDHVLSNVNNSYDPSSGIYTAPCTGVYSFYLSGVAVCDLNYDYMDLAISRRRNSGRPYGPLTRVFLRAYGDFRMSCQGSSSVKVKLEQGEQVVVCYLQGDLQLKGGCHTTFSGVLEFEYPFFDPLSS
ncbi:hypothetical protein ACOMHN_034739 [Nucella lapillus]